METLLLILFLLTIKHFIADFVIQTNWMVAEKGYYGKLGGIIHSAVHGIFTFVILLWFTPSIAVILALLDFVVHYHVDWAKMKIGRTYSYTPADKQFWFWIGVDQMLHYFTYILIALGAANVLS